MATLGFDTSNYASSLAVVNTAEELVCAKKRFLPVKEGELGLRQSEALFHHTVALPEMLAEIEATGMLKNITSVGVSNKPRPQEGSYMPCFLAGVNAASAFAAALHVPLYYTSHQQGHIAAALFGAKNSKLINEKALVFHISGGTTELLLTQGYNVLEKLGGSLDLYAGQAVDRLGVKLGFNFPAGAEVSALAAECDDIIKPKTSVKGMDCHLSGLQNQCETLLTNGKTPAHVARYSLVCIAATIETMILNARELYPNLPVICVGGVMSSTIIKARVQKNISNTYFVPAALASDNAVGVALIAKKENENASTNS